MNTYQYTYWALSKMFDSKRYLLGRYCWSVKENGIPIALFETRKHARDAQKTCCQNGTRVEKVRVTIEVVK